MNWRPPPRLRSEETWAEVRRAWEGGATGASLARRYDVGLANLWRRRASEGWERRAGEDPAPEPVVGWERHAQQTMAAFELRREETRRLAHALAQAMTGTSGERPLKGVPLWHAGYVLACRAERLGAKTAARDREWMMKRHGWAAEFWDAEGRLEAVPMLDALTLEVHREAWREDAGLPPGEAEAWP